MYIINQGLLVFNDRSPMTFKSATNIDPCIILQTVEFQPTCSNLRKYAVKPFSSVTIYLMLSLN